MQQKPKSKSQKRPRLLTYRNFWTIWALLVLSALTVVFAESTPDSDVSNFYKLLLVGLLVWLRQKGWLFKATPRRAFLVGLIFLFFPYGWILSLIIWLAPNPKF